MPAATTFDPALVIVSIGGVTMHGFADGTFVNVERERDTFTKNVGADGEVTRVKTNDKSGMLSLTLQQASGSNDLLSGFAQLDEQANSGIVPVLIEDKSGRTVLFSAEGWIRKPPAVEFGNEASTREWVLDLAKIDYFVGGN